MRNYEREILSRYLRVIFKEILFFGDPIVGTTKHIRIGGMKYAYDENIIIKTPSRPINTVIGTFIK
jgi:hypothetical protein